MSAMAGSLTPVSTGTCHIVQYVSVQSSDIITWPNTDLLPVLDTGKSSDGKDI